MYGRVLGAGAAAASTGVVLALPNTGNNLFLDVAISLGVGLAVWGLTYSRLR